MDISSIAGTAVMMQAAQTQENVAIKLVKMASDQQQQMVNMLTQNAQAGSRIAANQSDFNLSIFA